MAKQRTKDEIIDELIQLTQRKKDEIARAEKPQWLTNCSFGYEGTSVRGNIRTVSNPTELVTQLAYILGKAKDFETARSLIGAPVTFEYLGFSVADWAADYKTRFDMITLADKRRELDEIERQLDGLVSKERREQLQLEAIAKKLGISNSR